MVDAQLRVRKSGISDHRVFELSIDIWVIRIKFITGNIPLQGDCNITLFF